MHMNHSVNREARVAGIPNPIPTPNAILSLVLYPPPLLPLALGTEEPSVVVDPKLYWDVVLEVVEAAVGTCTTEIVPVSEVGDCVEEEETSGLIRLIIS
jgi:hypothetical protein